MNRIAKWLGVLAVVVSLGGHWVLLQSLAWTTMLARFSQSMPLTEAVAFTFDGKHPCPMCLAVQKGQKEERKESKLQPMQKLVLILDAQVLTLLPPPPFSHGNERANAFDSRSEGPPRPPPRGSSWISSIMDTRSLSDFATLIKKSQAGACSEASVDRIAEWNPFREGPRMNVGASELPRYDVPTYPDCENLRPPAKSLA